MAKGKSNKANVASPEEAKAVEGIVSFIENLPVNKKTAKKIRAIENIHSAASAGQLSTWLRELGADQSLLTSLDSDANISRIQDAAKRKLDQVRPCKNEAVKEYKIKAKERISFIRDVLSFNRQVFENAFRSDKQKTFLGNVEYTVRSIFSDNLVPRNIAEMEKWINLAISAYVSNDIHDLENEKKINMDNFNNKQELIDYIKTNHPDIEHIEDLSDEHWALLKNHSKPDIPEISDETEHEFKIESSLISSIGKKEEVQARSSQIQKADFSIKEFFENLPPDEPSHLGLYYALVHAYRGESEDKLMEDPDILFVRLYHDIFETKVRVKNEDHYLIRDERFNKWKERYEQAKGKVMSLAENPESPDNAAAKRVMLEIKNPVMDAIIKGIRDERDPKKVLNIIGILETELKEEGDISETQDQLENALIAIISPEKSAEPRMREMVREAISVQENKDQIHVEAVASFRRLENEANRRLSEDEEKPVRQNEDANATAAFNYLEKKIGESDLSNIEIFTAVKALSNPEKMLPDEDKDEKIDNQRMAELVKNSLKDNGNAAVLLKDAPDNVRIGVEFLKDDQVLKLQEIAKNKLQVADDIARKNTVDSRMEALTKRMEDLLARFDDLTKMSGTFLNDVKDELSRSLSRFPKSEFDKYIRERDDFIILLDEKRLEIIKSGEVDAALDKIDVLLGENEIKIDKLEDDVEVWGRSSKKAARNIVAIIENMKPEDANFLKKLCVEDPDELFMILRDPEVQSFDQGDVDVLRVNDDLKLIAAAAINQVNVFDMEAKSIADEREAKREQDARASLLVIAGEEKTVSEDLANAQQRLGALTDRANASGVNLPVIPENLDMDIKFVVGNATLSDEEQKDPEHNRVLDRTEDKSPDVLFTKLRECVGQVKKLDGALRDAEIKITEAERRKAEEKEQAERQRVRGAARTLSDEIQELNRKLEAAREKANGLGAEYKPEVAYPVNVLPPLKERADRIASDYNSAADVLRTGLEEVRTAFGTAQGSVNDYIEAVNRQVQEKEQAERQRVRGAARTLSDEIQELNRKLEAAREKANGLGAEYKPEVAYPVNVLPPLKERADRIASDYNSTADVLRTGLEEVRTAFGTAQGSVNDYIDEVNSMAADEEQELRRAAARAKDTDLTKKMGFLLTRIAGCQASAVAGNLPDEEKAGKSLRVECQNIYLDYAKINVAGEDVTEVNVALDKMEQNILKLEKDVDEYEDRVLEKLKEDLRSEKVCIDKKLTELDDILQECRALAGENSFEEEITLGTELSEKLKEEKNNFRRLNIDTVKQLSSVESMRDELKKQAGAVSTLEKEIRDYSVRVKGKDKAADAQKEAEQKEDKKVGEEINVDKVEEEKEEKEEKMPFPEFSDSPPALSVVLDNEFKKIVDGKSPEFVDVFKNEWSDYKAFFVLVLEEPIGDQASMDDRAARLASLKQFIGNVENKFQKQAPQPDGWRDDEKEEMTNHLERLNFLESQIESKIISDKNEKDPSKLRWRTPTKPENITHTDDLQEWKNCLSGMGKKGYISKSGKSADEAHASGGEVSDDLLRIMKVDSGWIVNPPLSVAGDPRKLDEFKQTNICSFEKVKTGEPYEFVATSIPQAQDVKATRHLENLRTAYINSLVKKGVTQAEAESQADKMNAVLGRLGTAEEIIARLLAQQKASGKVLTIDQLKNDDLAVALKLVIEVHGLESKIKIDLGPGRNKRIQGQYEAAGCHDFVEHQKELALANKAEQGRLFLPHQKESLYLKKLAEPDKDVVDDEDVKEVQERFSPRMPGGGH